MHSAKKRSVVSVARCVLLPVLVCAFLAPEVVWCQDSSAETNMSRGNRAEIAVTVRDTAGEEISAPAMVKIYRSGVPADQGATQKGRVFFVLNGLGDYTVTVAATGYEASQKDVSIPVALKVELEFKLKRVPNSNETTGVPGAPVLAPKAKEAFDKGQQALSAGKLKEAENYVSEALKLAPGNPDVWYLQGVLDLRLQNFAGAQQSLEKSTQIDPSHAPALAALGMALSDQRKYEEAIAPLEKALQLNAATGWEAYWSLAQSYYQRERYQEAVKTSQQALAKSNGKAPEIEVLVAKSLTAVGRYEDAAVALRDFLKNHGDRPEAATAQRYLDRMKTDGKIRRE